MSVAYPEIEGFFYTWNDGVTTFEREIYESGIYTLAVTSPNGNSNIGSVEVIIYDLPEVEIIADYDYYFVGQEINLDCIIQNDNQNGFNYMWNGINNFTSNIKNPIHAVEYPIGERQYSLSV